MCCWIPSYNSITDRNFTVIRSNQIATVIFHEPLELLMHWSSSGTKSLNESHRTVIFLNLWWSQLSSWRYWSQLPLLHFSVESKIFIVFWYLSEKYKQWQNIHSSNTCKTHSVKSTYTSTQFHEIKKKIFNWKEQIRRVVHCLFLIYFPKVNNIF